MSCSRVLDWIAEITAHIPNKGEQLVRYYGVYSNAWSPLHSSLRS
ncbi:MAG: transposase [Deltaproteobacteria bacterium]|nr:transposase [Deltaproteobacteria bacterium]